MSDITYELRKGADIIRITVNEDGLVKTETSKVSAPNHSQAEGFYLDVASLGKSRREMMSGAAAHTHAHRHGIEHSH
jgi:hypothetical protein